MLPGCCVILSRNVSALICFCTMSTPQAELQGEPELSSRNRGTVMAGRNRRKHLPQHRWPKLWKKRHGVLFSSVSPTKKQAAGKLLTCSLALKSIVIVIVTIIIVAEAVVEKGMRKRLNSIDFSVQWRLNLIFTRTCGFNILLVYVI